MLKEFSKESWKFKKSIHNSDFKRFMNYTHPRHYRGTHVKKAVEYYPTRAILFWPYYGGNVRVRKCSIYNKCEMFAFRRPEDTIFKYTSDLKYR